MTSKIQNLLDQNKAWSKQVTAEDPTFFEKLSKQQTPEHLWIGCSDSRVPANVVAGLMPGEVFVHRNIANVVVHSDMNMLSVVQYAVEHLKVKNIIVCGHYGCGGVCASMEDDVHGLVDNWLRPITNLYRQHQSVMQPLDKPAQQDLLCELNVKKQVSNVCHTTIVQNAWNTGQELTVHGVIYGLSDGVIKDLGATAANSDDLEAVDRSLGE